MNGLLLIPFLVLALTPVSRQQFRQIYDGRTLPPSPPEKQVLPADQNVFRQQILPAAKRQWREQAGQCDKESGDNFQIIDVAPGSFTKPRSNQRAILYRYCTYGHNFAYNGIAITETGSVVAHAVYDGAWDNSIYALADLNGNGLSELMISVGGTNQGETWGVIAIIEFTGRSITKFGQTETMSDRCGVSEQESSDAYVVYARPGKTPAFYREAFTEGCRKNARWRKTKPLTVVSLDTNDVEYQRLK